jgi:hypothetical protein
MTNDETRMTNEIGMKNRRIYTAGFVRNSSFVIVSSFGLRISDFYGGTAIPPLVHHGSVLPPSINSALPVI